MKTKDKLKLLACQIEIPAMITTSERDAHLAVSTAKVREAIVDSPVDIVVLPELSSIEYSRETFDNLAELAEPLDGPSYQRWCKVAKECNVHIVYSFARRTEKSTHISIAVVNPKGDLVGYYDKIHLAQYGASMEKEYFQRGNQLFTFTVKGFKIAPIICYDIRIPELCRTLVVDHGVDIILHCVAFYRDESFHAWHSFANVRAIENQIFFLSLNRAGKNYGDSLFCFPWMDENRLPIRFHDNAEMLLKIEIDHTMLDKVREQYTFLGDRLPTYDIPLISR